MPGSFLVSTESQRVFLEAFFQFLIFYHFQGPLGPFLGLNAVFSEQKIFIKDIT
jgi:hypothetical protein